MQLIFLKFKQEQMLDALAAPTASIPPPKLNGPREPNVNGRPPIGWSFLGQQGFPVITVPAGFTTEVWDRVRDPEAPKGAGGATGTRLVGPIPARLPVGIDFVGRPFDEPTLLKIGAAYEAATKHRTPPTDFGPLPGEP
jgi:amidase